MAVIKPVNSKASIGTAINYVTKEEKTEHQLITGKDCDPFHAIDSMKATKELFHKTDGREYAHFMQSFHADEKVTAEQVHEIACKWAERECEGYQCLIVTHIDKDHKHSHIIVNTVNFETGEKWHKSSKWLEKAREYSDELCRQYGLSITEKGKTFYGEPVQNMTAFNKDKYHYLQKAAEGKAKSYVLDTAVAFESAKARACSREEFISIMAEKGYETAWSDERKYITFTDKDGNKVRNSNIEKTFHVESSKESLENIFRKNQESRTAPDMSAEKILEKADKTLKETQEKEVRKEMNRYEYFMSGKTQQERTYHSRKETASDFMRALGECYGVDEAVLRMQELGYDIRMEDGKLLIDGKDSSLLNWRKDKNGNIIDEFSAEAVQKTMKKIWERQERKYSGEKIADMERIDRVYRVSKKYDISSIDKCYENMRNISNQIHQKQNEMSALMSENRNIEKWLQAYRRLESVTEKDIQKHTELLERHSANIQKIKMYGEEIAELEKDHSTIQFDGLEFTEQYTKQEREEKLKEAAEMDTEPRAERKTAGRTMSGEQDKDIRKEMNRYEYFMSGKAQQERRYHSRKETASDFMRALGESRRVDEAVLRMQELGYDIRMKDGKLFIDGKDSSLLNWRKDKDGNIIDEFSAEAIQKTADKIRQKQDRKYFVPKPMKTSNVSPDIIKRSIANKHGYWTERGTGKVYIANPDFKKDLFGRWHKRGQLESLLIRTLGDRTEKVAEEYQKQQKTFEDRQEQNRRKVSDIEKKANGERLDRLYKISTEYDISSTDKCYESMRKISDQIHHKQDVLSKLTNENRNIEKWLEAYAKLDKVTGVDIQKHIELTERYITNKVSIEIYTREIAKLEKDHSTIQFDGLKFIEQFTKLERRGMFVRAAELRREFEEYGFEGYSREGRTAEQPDKHKSGEPRKSGNTEDIKQDIGNPQHNGRKSEERSQGASERSARKAELRKQLDEIIAKRNAIAERRAKLRAERSIKKSHNHSR